MTIKSKDISQQKIHYLLDEQLKIILFPMNIPTVNKLWLVVVALLLQLYCSVALEDDDAQQYGQIIVNDHILFPNNIWKTQLYEDIDKAQLSVSDIYGDKQFFFFVYEEGADLMSDSAAVAKRAKSSDPLTIDFSQRPGGPSIFYIRVDTGSNLGETYKLNLLYHFSSGWSLNKQVTGYLKNYWESNGYLDFEEDINCPIIFYELEGANAVSTQKFRFSKIEDDSCSVSIDFDHNQKMTRFSRMDEGRWKINVQLTGIQTVTQYIKFNLIIVKNTDPGCNILADDFEKNHQFEECFSDTPPNQIQPEKDFHEIHEQQQDIIQPIEQPSDTVQEQDRLNYLAIGLSAGFFFIIIIVILVVIWRFQRRVHSRTFDAFQAQNIQIFEITEDKSLKKQQPCSICLQPYCDAQLSCKHIFHLSCIKAWSLKHAICPNCRNPLKFNS